MRLCSRRVHAVLWALGLLFALVRPADSLAQRNLAAVPAGETRVALVIGNSAYKESPLANPVNDATDMASALQSMGFKVILKRNAGTRDMRQAIREFGAELRRAQVGLFYFAGHGIQVKGGNYLIPVAADIQSEADVEDLAIDANYALRTMEEAQAKVSIVVLEWDACVRERGCGHNPSDRGWGRGKRPVINVSSQDAKAYTEWLSRKSGKTYRLLSEAEWEYAARAGTSTAFSTGASINATQANYDATYSYAGSVTGLNRRQTADVGSFQPNAFGLHDGHGNVWEWTEDCYNTNYNGAPSDGTAWISGDCSHRVVRGGSWYNNPQHLRSAYRSRYPTSNRDLHIGFRVARTD